MARSYYDGGREPGSRSKWLEFAGGFITLYYAVACMFAVPLCDSILGRQGCGISLDDALNYTLAQHDFNKETVRISWDYPGYIADNKRLIRRWILGGLTLLEADFGRRLIVATICGAIIGFERRSSDRPAGIRTMSLAALGACLFTICGTFAFINGPNKWDSSRISAALPSGVGFLGAGIIWKGSPPGERHHQVRGLTTAASVWISAATGCACGGGLYFAGIYAALTSVAILRYGPRMYLQPDYKNTNKSDTYMVQNEHCANDEEREGYINLNHVVQPLNNIPSHSHELAFRRHQSAPPLQRITQKNAAHAELPSIDPHF